MSAGFEFDGRVEFLPENSEAILRSIPAAPGIFALRGQTGPDGKEPEPYLTRTADLRRRLRRLLAEPDAVDDEGRPVLSRRLNLRNRVHSIEWTRTGSEFESTLALYRATRSAFGTDGARRRLRLHPPYFVRVTMAHAHPRVYVTNRLSRRSLGESFGPFPSRAAAERYCDAVLDLFKVRRCYEDLQPFPEHPGCAYGEMKKCLAPCKELCTPDVYKAEAARVLEFFATRGASLLSEVAAQREAASEAMDFEGAATLHKQWEKVRAASLLADEAARSADSLRALVVQEAAPRPDGESLDEAAIFLLDHGRMVGPERLSTLGVRAVREQTAVGSSLFAQPLMLTALPLDEAVAVPPTAADNESLVPAPSIVLPPAAESTGGYAPATFSPEERARQAIDRLTALAAEAGEPDIAERSDFLSLFRRWYYRPEKARAGEALLPNTDGAWPVRRLLNAAARAALGAPAAASPVDREGAKVLKTRRLHAGREGVERVVPVVPRGKSVPPPNPTSDVEHFG